jgi:hypothetical protein
VSSYEHLEDDPEFLAWWYVYPKKQAKGDAKKAWQQTAAVRPKTAALIKATRAAMASEQWRKEKGAYIPLPATYLRQERWDDVYDVDLSQLMDVAGNKVCAYCGKPASGQVNGKWACDADFDKALANEKTNVVQIGTKQSDVVDKKLQSCGS